MARHKAAPETTDSLPEATAAVDPQTYYRIFQQDSDGQKILAELARVFYDRSSLVPGDPYMTHAREGQRAVVLFILQKCGMAG